MIEKGRHAKPKLAVENRLCVLCDSKAVEDEYHFIMECTFYTDLRIEFFNLRKGMNLYNNNFEEIVSCKHTCFYLAKLLYKMFRKRNQGI
jgi:hypothetical protein